MHEVKSKVKKTKKEKQNFSAGIASKAEGGFTCVCLGWQERTVVLACMSVERLVKK
jgi:hypothetical protein